MFNWFTKNKKKGFDAVVEEQLAENISVLESLRDYDEGKKEISTDNVKARLSDMRENLQ